MWYLAGSGGGDGGKWRGHRVCVAGAKVCDSDTLAGETRTRGGGILCEFSGIVRPIIYLYTLVSGKREKSADCQKRRLRNAPCRQSWRCKENPRHGRIDVTYCHCHTMPIHAKTKSPVRHPSNEGGPRNSTPRGFAGCTRERASTYGKRNDFRPNPI